MDAQRYGIYLLVFTFDISLVCFAHLFDIDVNTLRKIPYLCASMYSLFTLNCFFKWQTTKINLTIIDHLRKYVLGK